MLKTRSGNPFTVIGENIHATRTVLRSGRHIRPGPDGLEAMFFESDGSERFFPIPERVRVGQDFASGRVKHVQAALLALMTGSEAEAATGRAYVETLARRQLADGADYIDLNVDEIAQDRDTQQTAMRLLVTIVEDLGARPSLDSSSESVIAAGIEASGNPDRLMLNSASDERPAVFDMAATAKCGVVVSAAGKVMPSGVDDRVANATRVVELARSRGLPLESLHLDPLVLPVGVDPEAGGHFLQAVSRLRADFGPVIHICGGLSNVSFGLPGRRLLNDVFVDLAAEAGADSGIIDPVSSNQERVFGRARNSRPYRLAADFLTGSDAYGTDYIAAYRAGELSGEV